MRFGFGTMAGVKHGMVYLRIRLNLHDVDDEI